MKLFQLATGTWAVFKAYNYIKSFILGIYIAVYKFNVICLSETYLGSTVATDDEILGILDYHLLWSDHPANT